MKRFSLLPIFLTLIVCCSAQNKEAFLRNDVANTQCDDYLGQTMDFAYILGQNPNSKGYIIIYEGKTIKGYYDKNSPSYDYNQFVYPRFGLAHELFRTIKQRFKFIKVNPKDLIFINGGFREKLAIEFWIVPNGAKPPELTPTLTKMPYRRGKPRGYCITI